MISALARIGRRPRLGLALGGGAARGLAHLGVLEVLEEHDLVPDTLAGTSIGALLGGLWLTSGSAESAIDRLQEFVESPDYHKAELEFLSQTKVGRPEGWSSLITNSLRRGVFLGRTLLKPSFVSEESYRHNVFHLLPEVNIEELRLPFSVVATDLRSGAPVVFRSGPLRDAVLASGAVPGVMPTQPINGRVLSDGALVDKVPARALLGSGVDVIIGVDVSSELVKDASLGRGLDVISRANHVTEWNLRHTRKSLCDIDVRPNVQDFNWLDFAGAAGAVSRGREAMEGQLGALRGVLRRARFVPWARATRARMAARLIESGWFGIPFVDGDDRSRDSGAE